MKAKWTAADKRSSDPSSDYSRWQTWGPYLSERAWGTVREDYSANGDAWGDFPHDHARSKVFRWNEDGLGGISDDQQHLCFALALWNARDPILKERLFGLAGPQGNHGEDVKEYYYYLDNTPTHSYMKMLYKYPQAEYPYQRLIDENARRGKSDPEFELVDTGIFDDNRYFDVFIEYAKAAPNDISIRFSVVNQGPEAAELHLLPTLWFRNTWAWNVKHRHPSMHADTSSQLLTIHALHHTLGDYALFCEGASELLFTDNETNTQRLYNIPNSAPYVKDAFHAYVIAGEHQAVNPEQKGTKAAAHYALTVGAGETKIVRLRLVGPPGTQDADPFADFDELFRERADEADAYYSFLQPAGLSDDQRRIQRQAFAGMLWSKQFYHFNVPKWLEGDPAQPPPPLDRLKGRNAQWRELNAHDILSMPDTWEYPWFAAWDTCFHCITLALLDAEFAKNQLILLHREWFQHPNGQIPAYEWNFSDVNPPVFAWAAWRVYKIDQKEHGRGDLVFLERIFHKLLINFTWWVNRKDSDGSNVFEGGFLGLDNIGVFDRSAELPDGGHIEQSDSTAWMGMFTLQMLTIALELACTNRVYEDIATKFFEHFLYIAAAMNNLGGEGIPLWNDSDEFFYDVLHFPGDKFIPMKVRSVVGLIPLIAVETIDAALIDQLPNFKSRLEWFLTHRPDLARLVSHWEIPGKGERRLLSLVRGHRMKRLLARALDPAEFLSDYGVRSMSKYHAENPFVLPLEGVNHSVGYEPGDSMSGLFGGNSNWRGPIWFPINFLLIESLQKYHHYYSDDFKVECPTGSGTFLTLNQIANELSRRLIGLFELDGEQGRPVNGNVKLFQNDPNWRDYIPFYEYFHADSGAGLGASHQTGWTGLVAKLIQQQGEHGKE